MALAVFPDTPGPDFNSALQQTPVVISAQFGDGYQQETLDGLNALDSGNMSLLWNTLTGADKDMFEAFLDAHAGSGQFSYRLPGTSRFRTFTCTDYKFTLIAANQYQLQANFARVFNVS